MKRKDIIVGMEIGICDNLRPDSTGNRHWSKGIATAVQKLHDGTYEVLYETLKGKPRGTNLSRVKPWADAKKENEVAGAAFRAQREAIERECKTQETRALAFHQVLVKHTVTIQDMAQKGVALSLDYKDRAVLTIEDPERLESLLAYFKEYL